MEIFKFSFGLTLPVDRKSYLTWGAILFAVKYLGEVVLYKIFSGQFLMPWQFLNPIYNQRYPGNFVQAGENTFLFLIALWTLPFLWVGVSMSIRRAVDAGKSPWIGLFFFAPILNFFTIAYLASLPTKNVPEEKIAPPKPLALGLDLKLTILCVFGIAFLGIIMMWMSISLFKTYGVALFLGTPFFLSALQAYFFNYNERQSFRKTTILGFFTMQLTYLALMLFALEGFICLAMAFPISFIMSLFGSSVGYYLSNFNARRVVAPLLILPLIPSWLYIDSVKAVPHRDSVVSIVEINAPPEAVWPNVIQFSELPQATEWLFKLGVAHPLRARIEGTGVGAIRHCEFSTGAFVEPITIWNEPQHLRFDVRYQPMPMRELTIYDNLDAPHLHGYFRSVQGEFRLIALPGGRTRLEGTTWYEMDIQPGFYWQFYSRWFIHTIHNRVLEHIKSLSEPPQKVASK